MPASPDNTAHVAPPLLVTFGDYALGAGIHVATPWLAGSRTEALFAPAIPVASPPGLTLYRSGALLIGHAREPFAPADLAARTQALYRRLLAAARGLHLYRIWNYVPQINAEHAGLEHYRAFCAGRSDAFEAEFGEGFQHQLPAASAVGCEGGHLDVIFAAGEASPQHLENPEQIPAYLYPREYGPRSPSFARATLALDGPRTWTFVSGTSAIKGHQTIASGDFLAQLECTLDNLRVISRTAGLGDDFAAAHASRRHFKVYLRHPSDLPAAQARLSRGFLQPRDEVTYLHAAICRASLAVEIEATVVTAR